MWEIAFLQAISFIYSSTDERMNASTIQVMWRLYKKLNYSVASSIKFFYHKIFIFISLHTQTHTRKKLYATSWLISDFKIYPKDEAIAVQAILKMSMDSVRNPIIQTSFAKDEEETRRKRRRN